MVERIHGRKEKLEPRKGLPGARARKLFLKAGMIRPAPMAAGFFLPALQRATVRADFTHGDDLHGTQGSDRALGIHIECAEGLQDVAIEFQTQRMLHLWREDIENAAPKGKLPGFRDGIVFYISCSAQVFSQELRRRGLLLFQLQAERKKALRTL